MKEREIYLDKLHLDEAKNKILRNFCDHYSKPPTEIMPVEEALGRVNVEAVFAQNCSPHYYASAMDGIAVKAEDTFGASKRASKHLTIDQEAFFVDTGDPLPASCNGVIMIENVNQLNETTVEITTSAVPGQHVRAIGEDITVSELILPANTKIGPAEIGGLLAAGITELEVKKSPEVAILPTGSELIEPGKELSPGKIIEYNSRVISSQIKQWGANPVRINKVKDDLEIIKERINDLSQEHDLVLVIAGSSAGEEDYTAQAIKELGKLLFHGVAIKPGKPLMAGIVEEKLVIGVPGYPVSAYLDTMLFIKPVIEAFLGLEISEPVKVKAELTRDLVSKLGQEEFVRTKLVKVAGKLKAVPLKRGAGVINSIRKADGFIRVPTLSQGLKQKEKVNVELHQKPNYQRNLLAVGEKDYITEKLKNQVRLNREKLNLHFKNLASEAALETLQQQAANIAVVKSISEAAKKQELSLLKVKEQKVVAINLGEFELGLVFKSDSSNNIASIEDLVKDDLSFVNRPEGMAARKLLDSRLQDSKINVEDITGYAREESTELKVVNLVKQGIVDVGIASQGLANSFDLDFVSLGRISSNLVIPESEYKSEKIKLLLEIIKSKDFKKELREVSGYDVQKIGEVIYRK